MLSAEDAAEYERMEQEVVELGRVIDREERARADGARAERTDDDAAGLPTGSTPR